MTNDYLERCIASAERARRLIAEGYEVNPNIAFLQAEVDIDLEAIFYTKQSKPWQPYEPYAIEVYTPSPIEPYKGNLK